MPLPQHYVKEIHSRLAVRYGSAWRSKWADVPLEALEADWADQLHGMQPTSIKKALESLPHDYPPTAPAFRALGLLRDEASGIKALNVTPDPAVAKAALAAMNIVGKPTPAEYMARMWARKDAGEKLTAGQRGFLASACRPGSDVRDGEVTA